MLLKDAVRGAGIENSIMKWFSALASALLLMWHLILAFVASVFTCS